MCVPPIGLPLTPAAESAMAAHVRANPKGKHGEHEYALERYGLREAEVRSRLRSYIERHDLA